MTRAVAPGSSPDVRSVAACSGAQSSQSPHPRAAMVPPWSKCSSPIGSGRQTPTSHELIRGRSLAGRNHEHVLVEARHRLENRVNDVRTHVLFRNRYTDAHGAPPLSKGEAPHETGQSRG